MLGLIVVTSPTATPPAATVGTAAPEGRHVRCADCAVVPAAPQLSELASAEAAFEPPEGSVERASADLLA